VEYVEIVECGPSRQWVKMKTGMVASLPIVRQMGVLANVVMHLAAAKVVAIFDL
jgi:hypothetical protein